MKKILLIEPYYGGSHQAFLDGLASHVNCSFTFLTLPARRWKMRMQLSAPWFFEQLLIAVAKGEQYDLVLCSSFLDASVFKALLANFGLRLPVLTYFHENQLVYPERISTDNRQFAAINFTTALTSDGIAFNSWFNQKTFVTGVRGYLKKAVDMRVDFLVEQIVEKSSIIYPGIDFNTIDDTMLQSPDSDPVIVWNHRWEYDKNPEEFFVTLFSLAEQNIAFKLIVLGQSFSQQPAIFQEACNRLQDRILQFGYVESREEYCTWLKQGDIIVSTAHHEFFGIAVIEGVRAGCRPLVPDRLSYPEIFPEKYRYKKGKFKEKLKEILGQWSEQRCEENIHLTEKFSWKNQAEHFEKWLDKYTSDTILSEKNV